MSFASSFTQNVLLLVIPTAAYSVRAIYISHYHLRIHWTKREFDWTKARGWVLVIGSALGESCNAVIATAAGSLRWICREISAAYLGPRRKTIVAAVSTSAQAALSCVYGARRQGRGFVPEDAATGRVHLKGTQQHALAALRNGELVDLTRGQYEEIAGVSRSQAAYDLAELVAAGILKRLGGGRATRYRLVRESRPAQRHWTDDRIRAELTRFCAGRKAWPSAGDFKAAGHADLYVAASRYGGIGFWASELGFARPGRAAPRVVETSLRRKLAWAGAGAVASAALALAAAAVVVLSLQRQSPRAVAPIRIAPTAASDESSHVVPETRAKTSRPVKRAAPVRRSHARVSRHVERARSQPTTTSSTATLVAYRTFTPPTTSSTSSPSETRTSTPVSSTSGGPTPLRAPLTASAPNPLKAPQGP